MHRKSYLMILCSLAMAAALLSGCAGMQAKPTESNFQAPVVTLSHVELQYYFGWWFYDAKAAPVKGKAGNNGAPLDYAFVFEITNPNNYPVQLDGFSFTIAFEEFTLNRAISSETMWIPAGKTNQLRVHAVFDVGPARTSLLVTGGFKLQEKGKDAWQAIEYWWTEAPNFSFPINVNEGSAVFQADGLTQVVPFSATFP